MAYFLTGAHNGSDEPPGPGRNGERNFHKEKRSNETHASITDPDAKLYRSWLVASAASRLSIADWRESRLCYMGHVLIENRHGLAVEATLTQASGTAERAATLTMLDRRKKTSGRITLGADKAYDVEAFVGDLRARSVTPHIAINGAVSKLGKVRKTAIDRRTTNHPGYAISQRSRKRIEEVFGWIKTQAGMAKTKLRGTPKVGAAFTLAVAAYNLIRIPKLVAGACA